MNLPARIGLVGCGAVSHQYLPTLTQSRMIEVTAVADVDATSARETASRIGAAWTADPDELMQRDDVDIVVNLTPIKHHAAVTRAALQAGKHVYSEKSLTASVADADELLAEARDRGLCLACAPDTLLGSGFQAARGAFASGAVGRPLTAVAMMLRGVLDPTVPRTVQFFDMAPYYVSALVTLFGPAQQVTAVTATQIDARLGDAGQDSGLYGVIEFAAGTVAHLTLVWGTDPGQDEVAVLDVFGTGGVLRFPNPNNFGDPAYLRRHRDPADVWAEIEGSRQPANGRENLRGLGVIDLACAIAEGRAPRASGELARHVVEIISGLVESGGIGRPVRIRSTCALPTPLSDQDRIAFLD